MNVFIEKLAEVCREHRVAEKWLIAPSLRVGHQWLDQVTRAGEPVLNVHVHTVRSLAMKVLATQLADGKLVVASPAVRRLVVAAAWQQVMTTKGYLGSARLTPGLLAMAERSLLDLRLAGLGPGDLDGARFEQAMKGRELRALLAAYQAQLEKRNLIDHADAARRAIEALRESGPPDIVVIRPDDLQLAVMERTLLDALTGEAVVSLPVDRPADPATPGTVESDLALLRWLERPTDAPDPVGDDSVRVVHSIGEANEVRGALRSCLAQQLPLDGIELLYTAADPYVPLLYDTAQRIFAHDASRDLGVPLTFADGVPARMSRPGRLLAAWHSWVHQDFPQSGLLRMLQAGLLRLPADQDGDPVSAARLVRMLRSVGIGFGRDRYEPCLDRKIESIQDRLDAVHEDVARDRDGRRLATARALAGLVKTLLAISPGRGAGAVRTVSAARTLLADHARSSGKLDGLALQRLGVELEGMVEALRAHDELTDEPAGFDGWEWIAELPDRIAIGGSGPRPGHLHVASVRGGGHSGRDRTIIVGLDDGRFPSAGRQDPLLLDHEREGLSDGLPTSKSRLREQVEEFGRLLCRLRGHLVLSFSSRSVDDDRETFAGPVVLASYRLVSGQRDGDHAALMDWLDPAISFAPRHADACLDAGEWWLHHAAGVAPVQNLPALADAAFEHLARGSAAGAARESDVFTVYDGRVDEPGAELDPAGPAGRPMSATALQTIGKCPLQYFYQRVLRLRPPDDVEVDPTRWLNALEFGTLLHDVLFEFVGALIADDHWPPEPARDLPRMAAIVEAQAAATRRRVPPPGEDAYRRQRGELGHNGEIFVNEQALRAGTGRPVYLETSIGMPTELRGTDIDAPDPVAIALPGGGTIRGVARIDRIDRDGNAFVVYDYKSGSYTRVYDPGDPFQQGRVVQHVLYMVVAEAALRSQLDPAADVEGFRFLFPGVRTHGREIAFGRDIIEPGLREIERLCRLPAGGAFPATDDVDDCRFCDYRSACQAVKTDLGALCAASGRKIDNADNAALKPFVELRRDA